MNHIYNQAQNNEIQVDKNIIQQKVLGNDRKLKKIVLPISRCNISDSSKIAVTLYQGNDSESRVKLVETSASILDDKMIVDIPNVFLRWNRDYSVVIDGTRLAKNDYLFLNSGAENDVAYTLCFAPVSGNTLFLWKMIMFIFPFAIAISIILHVDFWRALAVSTAIDCFLLYAIGLADCFSLIIPIFILVSSLSIMFIIFMVLKNSKEKLEIEWGYIFETLTFITWILGNVTMKTSSQISEIR